MPEATTTTANPVGTDDHTDFIRQFDQPVQVTHTAASAGPTVSPAVGTSVDKFLHPLRASEVVIGVSTIFLWVCFFLAGIVVETASIRELVSKRQMSSITEGVGAWFILLTSYTVTNFAILSCLAAIIGKFSRRSLSFETASLNGLAPAPTATFREVMVFYSVATARGFVIYLMLTGGLILLTTSAVTESSTEEYIKLASTLSIMAFMAGYDAEIFMRAIDRITTFSIEGKPKP